MLQVGQLYRLKNAPEARFAHITRKKHNQRSGGFVYDVRLLDAKGRMRKRFNVIPRRVAEFCNQYDLIGNNARLTLWKNPYQ